MGDPLDHAYQEVADALNYLDEFERQEGKETEDVMQSKLMRFHLLTCATALFRMNGRRANGNGNGRK